LSLHEDMPKTLFGRYISLPTSQHWWRIQDVFEVAIDWFTIIYSMIYICCFLLQKLLVAHV